MEFAIVCNQRTGSTLLAQRLDQEEDVLCNGAIFEARPGRVPVRWAKDMARIKELVELREKDPQRFLSRVLAEAQGARSVGFKICPGHNDAMLDRILLDPAIAKIVLVRSNALAVYSSAMIARLIGTRRSTVAGITPEARPRVEFDAKMFVRFWERYAGYYRSVFERLNSVRQAFHPVYYTELNDPRHFRRILNFIGSESSRSLGAPDNKKQNSPDILSRFSNPEAAAAFLNAHGLAGWSYETETLLDPALFG